jgi:hypothetical protein
VGPSCQPEKGKEGAAGALGRPATRPTAKRKEGRGWAKGREEGSWAFGPKLRRRIFLFPFLFLILQIHFQMIFEIIFFLK